RFAWDFLLGEAMVDRQYMLTVDSLQDGAGNTIGRPANQASFIGSIVQDTVRPIFIERSPTANAKNVELDSSFRFSSDRPLLIRDAFELKDSSDLPIDLELIRLSSTTFVLRHHALMPEAEYTLCVNMRQLQDSLNSQSIGDSTECVRFTTGTGDQSGSLAGTVRSEDSVGAVVVRIREISRQPRIRSLRTDAVRSFRFDGLKEGQYLLDAYIDRNGNNRYDFGKAIPWTRPEPYGAVRDTLRVRARWETKDVIIPIQASPSP
ncbi:MAG: hypothetical protein WC824_10110, partial [Bacteroidota bacterium]